MLGCTIICEHDCIGSPTAEYMNGMVQLTKRYRGNFVNISNAVQKKTESRTHYNNTPSTKHQSFLHQPLFFIFYFYFFNFRLVKKSTESKPRLQKFQFPSPQIVEGHLWFSGTSLRYFYFFLLELLMKRLLLQILSYD